MVEPHGIVAIGLRLKRRSFLGVFKEFLMDVVP